MRRPIGLAVLSLLIFCACSANPVITNDQIAALKEPQTVRLFYPSAGGSIEAYVSRPRGEGPFPLIVLLHGHSLRGRGAEQMLSAAELFANDVCFASLAISLPGYGSTQAPAGSIETVTRQAVNDGLALAKEFQWVDRRRIFFYGVSRGATVAAAMLSDVDGLSGAVLYAGAYDLDRLYRETPSFWLRQMLNPNGEATPKLLNLLDEGSKWRAPILIVHGEQDKLVPVNQSLLLSDRLKAAGTSHQLALYPDYGHFVPRAMVRERALNFFKEIDASACPSAKPGS
jgi:dipeptidyl aminopeptidase/acylaminoacyl peptidase